MIDFFNLSDGSLSSQVFYTKGSTDWQVWHKPSNCKIITILCIGSGAGGGPGTTNTSNTTRRGGGGGGSAAYSIGLFSASQLPDILYVRVVSGGAGGGKGITGPGTAGDISYVSVQPNTTAINLVLASGSGAAAAGSGSAGAGAGGAGGSVWTATGSILNDLGLITGYAGATGGTGQTTTTPTAIVPAGIVSPGAGGGGTNLSVAFGGGDITGSGFLPTILGGIVTGSADDRTGSSGFNSLNTALNGSSANPLFFTGGAGGAASNLGGGGDGGFGAFGSGGGGGGAGATGTGSGGAGGRGGDGLVIITSY